MGGGRTFLLDWAPGPYAGVLGPSLLGLNGGLTSGALSSVGFVEDHVSMYRVDH
jgi:hypothetical protein